MRAGLAPDHPIPGLRLAWTIDPTAEFRSDPILRGFSEWATTIVRIDIGRPEVVSHVGDEFRKFPEEFLLFLAVDVDLALHAPDLNRTISRKRAGDTVKLIENGEEVLWRVVDRSVRLTDPEVRRDATAMPSSSLDEKLRGAMILSDLYWSSSMRSKAEGGTVPESAR